MKIISAETMAQMQALIESGLGIRATARAVGLDRKTVAKYYPRDVEKLCQCGKPALHNGWCSVRVARSPNRRRLLQRMTSVKDDTLTRWISQTALEAQRTRYYQAQLALEAAWFKQAVIRENAILGTERLIEIATSVVARRVSSTLIAEDVTQDLLVSMLEGNLEALKAEKSPLVARWINYEWELIGWSSRRLPFDPIRADDDRAIADRIGQDPDQMTKDEFTAIAWRDFILWAHEQPEMRAAFTKATGLTFFAPARNALEAAIDEASGAHSQIAAEFVRWVTENHWGMDAAPAEYRATINESLKAS